MGRKSLTISKRMKRILLYRVVSVLSEYGIVYIFTGSLLIPAITTPFCIIVHTLLHYSIERIIK